MDSSATNPTLGHAALELTNLVGAESPASPRVGSKTSFKVTENKES